MGLGRNHVMVLLVKAGHAGIVPEDRDHPVFFPLDLQGRGLDKGFEKIIDQDFFSRIQIPVLKKALKSIVIAMIAPGLGDVFQLHVGGLRKAHGFSGRLDLRLVEVGLNDFQIPGRQGPGPFFIDL